MLPLALGGEVDGELPECRMLLKMHRITFTFHNRISFLASSPPASVKLDWFPGNRIVHLHPAALLNSYSLSVRLQTLRCVESIRSLHQGQ